MNEEQKQEQEQKQEKKVTLIEALRSLFGANLDQEISLDTEDPKPNENNNTTQVKQDEGVVTNGEEKEMPVTFNDGWFNSETMTIDTSKVSDEATRNALQIIADALRENNNNQAIERAIAEQINKSNISVPVDTFRRCLDTSNIRVGNDNKVVGVVEAFEDLKKTSPALFKDANKESNPLNEGFAPVNKSNASTTPRSFAEALEAEKALK